jgi:two-component system, NtrC family, sensor histidine kinase HydH
VHALSRAHGAHTQSHDPALAVRLAWITALRLVVLLALFGTTSAFYLRGSLANYNQSQRVLLWTFGTGFALAALYGLALRSKRHLTLLAVVQLICDQLTWTSFVYVSGGAASGATSFYALSALVGAILIGRRGAVLAAVLGLSLYLGVCFALAFEWLQLPSDQFPAAYGAQLAPVATPSTLTALTTLTSMAYPMLINGLGIAVVAVLSGYLAERLRTTGGRLEVAEERALAAEHLATLGRVAAGLAHEIRNPLGSIRGSIELLGDSPDLAAEDRALCGIIQREASRLEDLVSDMMDLSKPKRPIPELASIALLARDVVALAMRNERSGSGDVSVRYVGPSEGATALCDAAQMRQVLWNLVRNAVQVSQAGKEVTVEVGIEPGAVMLIVRDEGPGIDEEAKARIFDAFYTTRTHGAGLGLAVVKRILDDHRSVGVELEIRSPATNGAALPPFPPKRVTEVAYEDRIATKKASWRPPPLEARGAEFRLRLLSPAAK